MPLRRLRYAEPARDRNIERAAGDDEQQPQAPKAPQCPHCNITMLWYESHLRRDNGRQKIVHSFHCTNCAYVTQTEQPYRLALRVV